MFPSFFQIVDDRGTLGGSDQAERHMVAGNKLLGIRWAFYRRTRAT